MPIRDFLLGDDGDLAVVNGNFALVGGETDEANQAAVKQAIACRLRMFLGEYFLDESVGVDYFGQILVRNPDPQVIRELLRQTIAGTPDVVDVVGADLLLDSPTRSASISYTVQSVYSTEPITGTVAI